MAALISAALGNALRGCTGELLINPTAARRFNRRDRISAAATMHFIAAAAPVAVSLPTNLFTDWIISSDSQ
jgi:hypothetical protein